MKEIFDKLVMLEDRVIAYNIAVCVLGACLIISILYCVNVGVKNKALTSENIQLLNVVAKCLK